MNSAKERIDQMVAEGKIDHSDAQELLAAIDDKASSVWQIILNPFFRLTPLQGSIWVAVYLAGSLAVSAGLNVYFGDFLSTKSGIEMDWATAALHQAWAWFIPVLVFWLTSIIFAREGRFVDFVFFCSIGRLPILLFGLMLGVLTRLGFVTLNLSEGLPPTSQFIVILLGMIVFYGWAVFWLFKGFENASGLTGSRRIISFIVAIFAAIILSIVASVVSPNTRPTLEGDSPQVRASIALNMMEAGEFSKLHATFDMTMAAVIDADGLSEAYSMQKQYAGDFVKIDEVRTDKRRKYQIVDLICTFSKNPLAVRIVTDKEHRISGLFFFRDLKRALPPKGDS